MGALEWSRPLALMSLSLPLILLLLSSRRERPSSQATGTYKLWRDLPIGEQGDGRRRHIPLERVLIILALVSGSFALAGPHSSTVEAVRTWRVMVDTSPSMYLPHGESSTRMGVACDELYGMARAAGVRLRWSRAGSRQALDAHEIPEEWLVAPSIPRAEPGWGALDLPGTIWLTDKVPGVTPKRAGLVASGGGPAPGPIGTSGGLWLDWDGVALAERLGAPKRTVTISGGLPTPVSQVVRAWASERGLLQANGPVALHVEAVMSPGRDRVKATRDGWGLVGVGGDAPLSEGGHPSTTWLSCADPPRALITWVPGRVWVALSGAVIPSGDMASWAVSWAELLDEALLLPEGVVSMSERAGAGEDLAISPRVEALDSPAGEPAWPIDAILSALASCLALLALVLGRGRL